MQVVFSFSASLFGGHRSNNVMFGLKLEEELSLGNYISSGPTFFLYSQHVFFYLEEYVTHGVVTVSILNHVVQRMTYSHFDSNANKCKICSYKFHHF